MVDNDDESKLYSTSVKISEDQRAYIECKCLNLSAMVRKMIDELRIQDQGSCKKKGEA